MFLNFKFLIRYNRYIGYNLCYYYNNKVCLLIMLNENKGEFIEINIRLIFKFKLF